MSVTTSKRLENPSTFYLPVFTVFILFFGAFLRYWQIEARPLHSDEGVNFYFLEQIANKGIYPYSHENYHGPAYFWLSYTAHLLWGDSVLALRSISIIFGVLLILIHFAFIKHSSKAFVLIAAGLLAVSPSMVFHSRYGIHEMLFLFSCAGFIASFFLLTLEAKPWSFYLSAAFLGLMVANKETFVISLAAAVFSSIALGDFRRRFTLFMGAKNHILNSAFLFSLLAIFIYSSGFKSFSSLRELLFGLPQWVGRGTKSDPGHFKPFLYYSKEIIITVEPYLVIGMVLCLIIVLLCFATHLLKRELFLNQESNSLTPLERYLFTYTVFLLLVYSLIPYKTPWLVINITYPAILSTALVFSRLLGEMVLIRIASYLLLLVALFLALANTLRFNFRQLPASIAAWLPPCLPYGPGNPFSYVHTSPGMLTLIEDIKAYWDKNPRARVLIGVQTYWPLPYYLRERKQLTAYFIPQDLNTEANRYDIIIVDFKTVWSKPGWQMKYLRLSDVQEANIYFKELQS